jgi:multidrug resistance efflux pump
MPVKIHHNGQSHNGHFRMQSPDERISLRSESAREIISWRPGFLSRWSLLIFLAILLLFLFIVWLIRYPDIVQANASLTAANAPKELVIRQGGKLIRLFTVNDQPVTAGQTIAWIESTASHAEVIALSDLLVEASADLSRNETGKVSGLFTKEFVHLGELQTSYQQFITAWQQFNDYLVNGYYYKREKVLEEDAAFLKKMHESLAQQQILNRQDLQLTREAFDANDSLYNDKVISRQDLRDQKSKLVTKEMNVPQLESSILSNENLQLDKQKDIDELEHSISQQKIIFREALRTLKSLVDDWELKYILRAPVAGKVMLIVPLQENQFVQAGKMIGFVNPADSRYYAQVTLGQNNFGKVYVGEKVLLRFDAYPYQEFGSVVGKLSYISKVPSDSGFLANIALPGGLMTNYGKEIQYRSGLKSQAMIITRDMRMLQRFYYTIVKGAQR